MNHMLNTPIDQPDQHMETYDRLMNNDNEDDITTTTVTLDNPQGMSTPWQQWTDAVFILLDEYSLQQLPTEDISPFGVRDSWTACQPNPDGGEDLEYELETGTKFHLRIQEGEAGSQPKIVGEMFSFESSEEEHDMLVSLSSTALATVQIKIEFKHSDAMRTSLLKMLANGATRKQ